MGLSCEGMGLGCEAFGALFFFAQSYKINQRAPNIRAKKTEKSDESGFCRGCNALTVKKIHAFVKG